MAYDKLQDLFDLDLFIVEKDKQKIYKEFFNNLTKYHYTHSQNYKKILDLFNYNDIYQYDIINLPFLPVRLFKEIELKTNNEISKIATSSGTSGSVSKIYLDKITLLNQTKVLSKIVTSFIGKKRLPMIVLDTKSVLKDRFKFSARGSGILGFSLFARDRFFAFDDNMRLDIDGLKSFLQKYKNQKILLFGFTYMVWKYFYKSIKKHQVNLANGILFHGGGWKKLEDISVSNEEFKKRLYDVCSLKQIHNYYGMIEQTGSIFVECEYNHLHTTIFSDIIIRDENFNILDKNKKGFIQLLSTIPTSYPGHNILSEDIGEIIGIDDCKCGRGGKYFKVIGRVKKAEIRGCSDTFDK